MSAQSVSYGELQQVDTAIANDFAKPSEGYCAVSPSNIQIIHITSDNLDDNEETVDGKNMKHAAFISLYQRKLEGNYADWQILPLQSQTRDHTLLVRFLFVPADEFTPEGKIPKPQFPSQVEIKLIPC